MSKPDDKKPDTAPTPAPPTAPKLRSVRFTGTLTLTGVNPSVGINFDDPKDARFEVAVVGASVFIKPPGEDVFEVPRASCVLRWRCAAGTVDEAVKAIGGRK